MCYSLDIRGWVDTCFVEVVPPNSTVLVLFVDKRIGGIMFFSDRCRECFSRPRPQRRTTISSWSYVKAAVEHSRPVWESIESIGPGRERPLQTF